MALASLPRACDAVQMQLMKAGFGLGPSRALAEDAARRSSWGLSRQG